MALRPSAPPRAPSISSMTTQFGLRSPRDDLTWTAFWTRSVSTEPFLSSDALISTTR